MDSASQAEIVQTTRLARKHGFDYFESGRGANASYEDTQFLELQTFMGMVGCGTAQGAARFQYRRGEDYGPHGDTHLRAVKPSEASSRRRSASTERASSSVRLDVEPPRVVENPAETRLGLFRVRLARPGPARGVVNSFQLRDILRAVNGERSKISQAVGHCPTTERDYVPQAAGRSPATAWRRGRHGQTAGSLAESRSNTVRAGGRTAPSPGRSAPEVENGGLNASDPTARRSAIVGLDSAPSGYVSRSTSGPRVEPMSVLNPRRSRSFTAWSEIPSSSEISVNVVFRGTSKYPSSYARFTRFS